MSKTHRLGVIALCAAGAALLAACGGAPDASSEPRGEHVATATEPLYRYSYLTPTTCPTNTSNLFTTGGQYLDPNNGVLQNQWSMLMRWQGSNMLNPVAYNGGDWTTLTPPAPYSNYQRGYSPANGGAATPLTQMSCFDAGMILNSWYAPHTTVVGGGFNDMYGYAFGPNARPYAFRTVGSLGQTVPADLVIQGNLAATGYQAFELENGVWSQAADPTEAGSAQLDFFIYLQDSTHPNLNPIAILAAAFSQGWQGCAQMTHGKVDKDYPSGVWYGATGFCDTDISSSPQGSTTSSLFGMTFFRIHYTPQNFANLIARINAQQCAYGVNNSCHCTPGVSCPAIGYNPDPSVYQVRYGGVIAETSLCKDNVCSTDRQDRNVGFAARMSNVAMLQYANR